MEPYEIDGEPYEGDEPRGDDEPGDAEPCEGDDERCAGAALSFRSLVPSSSLKSLVPSASPGANRCVSSPNDRWHEGQETAVSEISCLHEGHFIGGALYRKSRFAKPEVAVHRAQPRREAPGCNSPDRQVGVTVDKNSIEA